MLTVTNNPAKQKGVKVSRWVACHNPVVFKVQTDAIPNTRDTPENFVSVADSRGFAVFTLSSTSNPDWYRPFLKISIDGYIYSDVGTVTRFDPETLEVYTDMAFNGDDSGEAVKFYDGYLIDLLPTIGLPSGHVWENQKPESLGSIQQIEPSGGVAVFDIQKQLQRNVSAKNDLFQVSFPNDLNAFTGFRVAYRESYIDLLGEIEESTAISAYDELSGFVSLTVASVSGFSSGGYAILEGFTEGKYNGAVVKIRQVVNSTTLQIEVSYDAYLSLSASETIQPYSLDLVRFSSSYTNEGSQYWAVNSAMELGSFYGTNLVDYVASSPSELAEFMTVFSERNVFIDQFEDFTIIVDTPLLDSISGDFVMAYRQEQYDKGGNLIASDIEVITSQGEGVYRLPTGGNPTEAITNLVAEGGVYSIILSWDALETIPLFAKYEIWRSLSPDVLNTGSLLATSSTNSYTDTATDSGVTYYYIVRSIGAYASKFSNEVDSEELTLLPVQTNWNIADGNFVAVIVSTETVDLIVGNTTYTGNSFSINDSFFDGTDKTITLVANDYSLISNFDITAKLINTIDLSLLTGAQRIDVRQNAGLTGLLTASNNLGANDGLRANLCNLTGVQDFSNTLFTNTAFIDLTSNANLTGVEFSTGLGVNSISDFRIPNCNFSGRIDATNAIIQSFNAGAGNSGLTGIDFYSGAIVDGSGVIALGCNFTGLLDLSFLAISSLTVQNQSLTSVIISSFSKRMTTISLNGQNIRTIDFGGATFSGAGNIIQLQDLNGDSLMTSAQISQMVIDINARATTGTGTLRFDGNNPVLNAGGIVAKDSLISKGYTVLFN